MRDNRYGGPSRGKNRRNHGKNWPLEMCGCTIVCGVRVRDRRHYPFRVCVEKEGNFFNIPNLESIGRSFLAHNMYNIAGNSAFVRC